MTPLAGVDCVEWGSGGWESVAGDRACSRREGLYRDVAWLGAAPVGSRLYYCLEEASWEASHDRAVRRGGCGGRGETPISKEDGKRDRTTREGSLDSAEGEAAVMPGYRGDTEGVDALGEGDLHRRGPRKKDDVDDANSSEAIAAMVFARSVSEMLADAYVGPGCNGGEQGSNESSAAGGGGAGNVWPSLVVNDSCGAVGTPGAASFLVAETTDAHRSRPLRPRHADGVDDVGHKQRFDAVAAVPDVLVADVGVTKRERDRKRVDSPGSRPGALTPKAGARGRRNNGDGARGQSVVDGRDGTRAKEQGRGETSALHFAPAGVLQLLGTPHCREFLEALPPSARERLGALYGGGGVPPPPVGHLYFPLVPLRAASPATRIRPVSQHRSELPPSDLAGRPSGASEKPVAGAGGGGGSPAVVDLADGGGRAAACARRSSMPLLGALLHPLPARAMRELLQVYVATTRAIGVVESPDGLRRTSGLFAPPPRVQRGPRTPGNDDGVERGRAKGDDAAGCRHRAGDGGSVVEGGEAGPVESCSSAVGGLGEGRCCFEDYSERGDGLGVDVVDLAATPPSAVDVLPDAPGLDYNNGDCMSGVGATSASLVAGMAAGSVSDGGADDVNPTALENGGGGGGSSGGGVNTHANSRSTVASPGISVGGEQQKRARAGERQTPPEAVLRVMDSAPILSSLRARFRRAYVVVLAPPSATTVGNGNGNGRAVLEARSKDPFLGASALFLQVEIRVQSPTYRCVAGGKGCSSGRAAAAVGGGICSRAEGGGAAAAAGVDAAGAGEGVVPAVCRWRGCLANALVG